jgi:pSer/pThr/pTyr-binding forkhead associated (FHA) protein
MPPPENPLPKRRTSGSNRSGADRPSGVRKAVPAPAASVVCVAGPAEGQTFSLTGDEVVVGRGSDNPISVADTSMSRKHALLRKTDEGWALSDLGSGNGTVLNGEPIEAETPLSDQDVFVLGDSEFRFEDAKRGPSRRPPVRTARSTSSTEPELGGPQRARPARVARVRVDDPEAAGRRRRRMIAAATVLASLMIFGIGYTMIQKKRGAEKIKAEQAEAARVATFAKAFQDAKKRITEGKWAEAKQTLEEIKETDPDFEPVSIASYLERAEAEIPNQKAMGEAAVAIKELRFEAAARALGQVKKTFQEQRLKTLKDEFDVAFNARLNEGRMMSSSTGDRAKMVTLKALADDLVAAQPEDKNANELKKLAESSIARIDNPNLPPPPPETPHLQVQNLFRGGDDAGALNLAAQCGAKNAQCRSLEQNIKDFQTKLKNLDNLGSGELSGLFELDRKISGGQSSALSAPIKTRLVAAFYGDATKAKAVGNWSKATEYARKVLLADPSHPGAQSIVGEARRQASELYMRAYQLRESSPEDAIKMFKDVVQMTPPDDEYHEKAQTKIKDLQK